MTAAEVIEQIKALPEGEKEIVYQFVKKGPASTAASQMESIPPAKYASPEDLDKSANKVFNRYRNLFEKLAK